MLNISTAFINLLQGSTAVTSLVPASSIMTGPVDIVVESQSGLLMPQINLHPISEVVATVPLNTKQTRIQLDIWSRKSELEAEQIYEAVISALNFQQYNNSGSHIYWQRLDSLSSTYESEVRLWHYSADFLIWSLN